MKNEISENSSDLMVELNKGALTLFKKRVASKMMIAARIDDVRKERNWSKNDLAKVFKKLPSEITKWLSGTHNFTIDTIVEIEDVLKINLLSLEEKKDTSIIEYDLVSDIHYPEEQTGVRCPSKRLVKNLNYYQFTIKENYSKLSIVYGRK